MQTKNHNIQSLTYVKDTPWSLILRGWHSFGVVYN